MQNFSVTKRILEDCLDMTKEDTVLVINDDENHSKKLAEKYIESARKAGVLTKQIVQKPQTELASSTKELVHALQNLPEKNIVILCVSNKLGKLGALGKSFRRFCQQQKHRFISTTGLGSLPLESFETLISAMNVDYMNMQIRGLWLKKKLDTATKIRITTEIGTDITFDVFGMQAICNAGNYTQPGTGGNIPAGEVYMAPRGTKNVKGVFVVDGSLRTDKGGILLKSPVKITVQNGRVVNIEGNDAHLLEAALKRAEARAKYPERVRIIGEVGFGINPNAKIVGTTIIDEKVQGTAHIAIGSNYWFGGANKTIFHADQVFKNPTLFIDGNKVQIQHETSNPNTI